MQNHFVKFLTYGTKIILRIGCFIFVCQFLTWRDQEAQTQHQHNCYIPVALHDIRQFSHLQMSYVTCMAALCMGQPCFGNLGIQYKIKTMIRFSQINKPYAQKFKEGKPVHEIQA